MSAQVSSSEKSPMDNADYLLGKLVSFTFKQTASDSASIEGIVMGFAHFGGTQCAYMHTGTGEEFFVPLNNIAYMMISNQGIPSAQLMQEKTEVPFDKLPAELKPPTADEVNKGSVAVDSDSDVGPSSDQLVHSLKNLMKGESNETK